MAKQENRPRDRNQLAKFIVDAATDESKGKTTKTARITKEKASPKKSS